MSSVVTQLNYDEMQDTLVIKRSQDVEPYLARNKRLANESAPHWQGDLHHVASIPLVVLEKVKNETGVDLLQDSAALKRFLNDPSNKFLRTKSGRI